MPQHNGTPIQYVGCGAADSKEATPELVGNKAAGLIRIAAAGLPVPPAFVLPTSLCREYLAEGARSAEGLSDSVAAGSRALEQATGLAFGGNRRPLLVSVRSGAKVSMPGMMDSILNLGLCDRTLPALLRTTGNPRHAWDSYRRLVQAYGEVVQRLPGEIFESILNDVLVRERVPSARELDAGALKELTQEFLARFESSARQPFPQDPRDQLLGAVQAIFRSWNNTRAVEYRRLNGLDDLAGTAATVQAMVFGNIGGMSGSGVAFTRDPATGEKQLYLDFLWNAQGEDVVSGHALVQNSSGLQQTTPELYGKLLRTGRQLEELFGDVQDFEFTVQEGELYLLQSRDAKRTSWAALRTACDLVDEGLIDEQTALQRLAGCDLHSVQRVRLAGAAIGQAVASGTPASPGVAVGEIVLEPAAAAALASQGRSAILVRADVSPADFAGFAAAAGVLTSRGGRTSHAAVVARQLDKACIVGCQALIIDRARHCCRLGAREFQEGDCLSLDGQTGNIYAGSLPVVIDKPDEYVSKIEQWKAALRR